MESLIVVMSSLRTVCLDPCCKFAVCSASGADIVIESAQVVAVDMNCVAAGKHKSPYLLSQLSWQSQEPRFAAIIAVSVVNC